MRIGDYVICGFYDLETQFSRASWKESHLKQVQTGKLTRFALYNLKKDPQQLNDLSQKEESHFNQLKSQLQDAHLEMQKQAIGWLGDQPVKSY